MGKILIYKTHDGSGLANRLRALIGYKALASCLDMDLELCWTCDTACPATADQLFARDFCRLIPMNDVFSVASNRNFLICEESTWFDSIWSRHGSDKISYEQYLEAVRAELRDIRFAMDVMERVETASDAFNCKLISSVSDSPPTVNSELSSLPGIHIRHTDNTFEYKKWSESAKGSFNLQKTSSLDGFYALMDEFAKDGRFFLASDNQDVTASAFQRYGDRVLTYNKSFNAEASDFWRSENPDKRQLAAERQFYLRTRTTSITDALVELLLLSRCREVTGTYYSSFGKMAAMLGGIPYSEIQGEKRVSDPMLSGKMQLRCSQFLRT